MLDLASWPPGMRLIVRKERPHPGAQLRLTGIDGHRFTCFATSTKGGQLADLSSRPAICPRPRLTSRNHPRDQEGNHQGPWNPPTRRVSRATRHRR